MRLVERGTGGIALLDSGGNGAARLRFGLLALIEQTLGGRAGVLELLSPLLVHGRAPAQAPWRALPPTWRAPGRWPAPPASATNWRRASSDARSSARPWRFSSSSSSSTLRRAWAFSRREASRRSTAACAAARSRRTASSCAIACSRSATASARLARPDSNCTRTSASRLCAPRRFSCSSSTAPSKRSTADDAALVAARQVACVLGLLANLLLQRLGGGFGHGNVLMTGL